eukprot:2705268-Rhodomonas_salina.2
MPWLRRRFIRQGLPLNRQRTGMGSALHAATRNHRTEAIEVLLRAGADVELRYCERMRVRWEKMRPCFALEVCVWNECLRVLRHGDDSWLPIQGRAWIYANTVRCAARRRRNLSPTRRLPQSIPFPSRTAAWLE